MAHADLEAVLRRMRAELRDESFTNIELRGTLRGVRPRQRKLMRCAAGRGIGDAGAAAIAEALKINKTVTTIYLYSALCAARDRTACCGARGSGGAARKLMRVGAPGNSVGPAGAAAIAEALKINKTVTKISLGCALCSARDRAECGSARGGGGAARNFMRVGAPGNSVGPAGAAAIAEALKINKTVTAIDLTGALCAARDRAECRPPAVALRASSCGVGAPDNSIGPTGAAAIAEALKINKTVTTISLFGTFMRRAASACALVRTGACAGCSRQRVFYWAVVCLCVLFCPSPKFFHPGCRGHS